jgi:hypothetical protein
LLVTGYWLLVWKEIPNINIQNTNKFQYPVFNIQTGFFGDLSFEIWDLFGIWFLGFGIFLFIRQSSIVNRKW